MAGLAGRRQLEGNVVKGVVLDFVSHGGGHSMLERTKANGPVPGGNEAVAGGESQRVSASRGCAGQCRCDWAMTVGCIR